MGRTARRRLAAALAAAALLVGCSTPSPAVDGDGDASSGVPSGGGPATPQVPPLHPATDHLDEAVVHIATASGEQVRVDVKVAAADAERRRGLMEVADLPDGVGMLFVFDDDRTGGFWMRDTLVALDIAFADADGTVGTILAMEPCTAAHARDCEVYTPDGPYRLALEVPQGWFDAVGVRVGATLRWSEPVPPPGAAR